MLRLRGIIVTGKQPSGLVLEDSLRPIVGPEAIFDEDPHGAVGNAGSDPPEGTTRAFGARRV
jgi:hypothetical protein